LGPRFSIREQVEPEVFDAFLTSVAKGRKMKLARKSRSLDELKEIARRKLKARD
jgi:hypothetical protein